MRSLTCCVSQWQSFSVRIPIKYTLLESNWNRWTHKDRLEISLFIQLPVLSLTCVLRFPTSIKPQNMPFKYWDQQFWDILYTEASDCVFDDRRTRCSGNFDFSFLSLRRFDDVDDFTLVITNGVVSADDDVESGWFYGWWRSTAHGRVDTNRR